MLWKNGHDVRVKPGDGALARRIRAINVKLNEGRRMRDANKNGRKQKLAKRRSGDEKKWSVGGWKNSESSKVR